MIRYKNDVRKTKTNCICKRWISFFWGSWKYERSGSRAKLRWRPSDVTYFARDPLRSYFHEPQKNEIYFLNIYTHQQFPKMNLFRTDEVHTPMNDIHATLRVINVIEKCNYWLADVTFDWCHVMVTAVERNNQACRITTFLRRLFARFKSKFHK